MQFNGDMNIEKREFVGAEWHKHVHTHTHTFCFIASFMPVQATERDKPVLIYRQHILWSEGVMGVNMAKTDTNLPV